MAVRYFRLLDHIGVAPDGELEPINEVGVAVAAPAMVGGEVVAVPERLAITSEASPYGRVSARDPRVVESSEPRVCAALLECGQYVEVDAPKGKGDSLTRAEDAKRKGEATADDTKAEG